MSGPRNAEECETLLRSDALQAIGQNAVWREYILELESEVVRLGGSLPLNGREPLSEIEPVLGFDDLLGV